MKKKNVLFLLTDDQRYNTLHAVNCPQISTPNLDRLVREGTCFLNAHIEGGSSGAVCMPSRAMINSGRSLFHIQGEGENIPSEHICMCEQFRNNGYETFGTGKWHNGPPAYARSFTCGDNIFFGGMWDHWNVPTYSYDPTGEYDNVINFVIDSFHSNEVTEMRAERVLNGKHSSELLSETAVSYLKNYHDSNTEKPFFLYCAFLAPHDPRTMPDRFRKMYRPEDIALPANFMSQHPFPFGVEGIRDEILANYPRSEQEIKKHIAEYYGMISHLDEQIGNILTTLEEIGELENTIIVMTGDNGLAVGCHGLMGKQNLYEHSIRVPLVLRGPGIPQNALRQQPVYLYDIYPTLCDLNGIAIPDSVEGTSFAPAIADATASAARDAMYFCYTSLIRAVKQDGYKLIEYRNYANRTSLFHLDVDPDELHDLAEDPAYQDRIKSMRETLRTLASQYESDNVHSNQFWKAF